MKPARKQVVIKRANPGPNEFHLQKGEPLAGISKHQRHCLLSYGINSLTYGKSRLGVYPSVHSEFETLDQVLAGRSIARYGDGELGLALGGTCISQRERHDKLRLELIECLAKPENCLVGIPNIYGGLPERKFHQWLKLACVSQTSLYKQKAYHSSFITRPDSAPWINTPAYWEKVRSIWAGKSVTLVYGGPDSKSLKPEWLLRKGAVSVRPVVGKRTNAYCGIDELEEAIGRPVHPVLICLGPTATVLAWRLAKKGLWALDLGHLGMFMK